MKVEAGRVWTTRWKRGGLRLEAGDLVAGVTVALVLLPQSLAYAQLAGMPAYRGLYAAVLPPIVAALFASSPYLQTGPVAITSILAFGALSALAPPGSDEYVELGLLLALVVGVARLVLGLLRGGVLAYLMSYPVLVGFTSAAAVLIVSSQLPTALGVEPPVGGILHSGAWALAHPGAWELSAILLAAGVLALVLLGGRLGPRFPAVLLAIVGATLLAAAADYGGSTVGPIPASFPPLTLSFPWDSLGSLLLPGLVIAVVGFAEPASIARTFAALERKHWDSSREFVSQGAANVAAAVTGGFPVGGSFSRSALNRRAGARTRWSGAVTGFVVLAFLPFAGALSSLPRAALAGIVIAAVLGLIRIGSLLELWGHAKPQVGVGWITFAATLAFAPHVERGVIVGVATATAVHLWRELLFDFDSWTEGETLHVRLRGVLWFGTVGRLEERFVRVLAAHPEARSLAVHMGGLGRIDLTGALALRGLLEDAEQAGLAVEVQEVPPRAQGLMTRVLGSRFGITPPRSDR